RVDAVQQDAPALEDGNVDRVEILKTLKGEGPRDAQFHRTQRLLAAVLLFQVPVDGGKSLPQGQRGIEAHVNDFKSRGSDHTGRIRADAFQERVTAAWVFNTH